MRDRDGVEGRGGGARRRTVLLAAGAGGAGAVFAAACGGAQSQPAERAAPNPAISIEFWHNKAQPEGQDVTAIVGRYNAQFAPTSVKESFQGNLATLLPKLRAALAAGTPPDVSNGSGRWMPAFAEQGALIPADDLIKRLGGFKKEDFYPAVIASQTWKGRLQALPYGTASKGYYFRPDVFAKENVTRPPTTWEEFDQAATRLTRDERAALGMSPSDFSWFLLLLAQRGGKVLDPQTGKATFQQQPGIDALAQLTELAQRKRTLRLTADSSKEFANGQLASLMSGEWQVRFYRADGTVHDTALFPRPKAADPPMTLLGVEGLYVYKNGAAERLDATWRFLTWLLKPDVYHSWAVTGSFRLPMAPAWVKSEEYQKFLKENPQQRPFAEQLPNAVMNQPTVYGDELEKALGAAVQRAVTGEQSPRDSLAAAGREFDALG
jgi:multiple sugar transport system substrate-binding protein